MKTLIDFIDRHHMLPDDGGLVLCAVSGGTDSMCLLWAMNELSKVRSFSIAAIHFEHGQVWRIIKQCLKLILKMDGILDK